MIDPGQLRLEVIRPTLRRIDLWSLAAEKLLLGTALAESVVRGRQYLRQLGKGPARSIYQVEPVTAKDLRNRFLRRRSQAELRKRVLALEIPDLSIEEQLTVNLAYATAIARLRYWSRPESLPAADDLVGIARYWKQHYNTHLGAGPVQGFLRKVRPYL